MIYSLEPVVGALMAFAFLGERWGPLGWAGGATIFAASVCTQLAGATANPSDGGGDDGPSA
jgi:drug/metabolite transporter (DMT)-like permease